MNTDFKSSFLRDIKKISDKNILNAIEKIIENVETAKDIRELNNLKKIKGYSNFYRLKIDDFRLGVSFENNTITFVRFLHRKDIYKFFP